MAANCNDWALTLVGRFWKRIAGRKIESMTDNDQQTLLAEVERNREVAKSLRKILDQERDMLVAAPEERLTLTRFHTDIWDSLTARGSLSELKSLKQLTKSYQLIKELNTLIEKFKRFGNIKTYTHYSRQEKDSYSRIKLLDLIEELCQEAYLSLSHFEQDNQRDH